MKGANDHPPQKKRKAQDAMIAHLRSRLVSGDLRPNDELPSEAEMTETYQVSSRVVRECMAALEAEGFIHRRQGRRTIVLETPSSRKQKNVGVIFLDRVRDTSTLELLDGLQHTFQRGGYGTTVLTSNDDPETESRLVEQLAKDRIPGVILYSAHPMDSFAHLLAARKAGMEMVVIDHFFPDFPCSFVGIDDQLAGYEAAVHMIRRGCQELVFIDSSKHHWTTGTLRCKGFENAVTKVAQLAPNVIKVPLGFDEEQYLHREFAEFLKTAQRPLGVVVWNDIAALHVIECLRQSGWSVPEDAAVIGFADDLDGAIAMTPLTTIQIPREDIARQSAYLLMDHMRNPRCEIENIELRPRLVIRETCGAFDGHTFSFLS